MCATKTRSQLSSSPSESSCLCCLSAPPSGCKCYQMFYTCCRSPSLFSWTKPSCDMICYMVTSLIRVSRLHSNCSRTYRRSLSNLFNRRSEELLPAPPAFFTIGEVTLEEDLLFNSSRPSTLLVGRILLPSILRRLASSTREPTMFPYLLLPMILAVPFDICGRKVIYSRAVLGLLSPSSS